MRVIQTRQWIAVHGVVAEFGADDALVAGDDDARGRAVRDLVTGIGFMPDDGKEHLYAVAMDCHGVPLAVGHIATGSVDNVPLFPRDIFSWALTVPLARFVGVVHNHPSGDVTPSGPDVAGTSVVAASGKMLGLDLVWSMVVTHRSADWRLIPIKMPRPTPGEREPYQPKAPEDEPKEAPEDEAPAPEPDDDDDSGAPEPDDEPGSPDDPAPVPDDEEQLVKHHDAGTPTATEDDIRAAVKRLFGARR